MYFQNILLSKKKYVICPSNMFIVLKIKINHLKMLLYLYSYPCLKRKGEKNKTTDKIEKKKPVPTKIWT